MLTYEICKRLKEAGFPQKEFLTVCEHSPIKAYSAGEITWHHATCQSLTYDPTLSELIEACGPETIILKVKHKFYEDGSSGNWAYTEERTPKNLGAFSSSLEEAVADLYLKLKEITH